MIAWIKEHLEGVLMMSLTVAACITVFYLEVIQPEPAQAAAPAAGPMCVPIGIVGNVIIARCEDEDTGAIIYANSAGFMVLGE